MEELIADATEKGGRVTAGGARHALGGSFFQPTVISNATPDMRFMQEEIFGPVAPVFRFETEEEAVKLANDTVFGLCLLFLHRRSGPSLPCDGRAEIRSQSGSMKGSSPRWKRRSAVSRNRALARKAATRASKTISTPKYVCIGGLGL